MSALPSHGHNIDIEVIGFTTNRIAASPPITAVRVPGSVRRATHFRIARRRAIRRSEGAKSASSSGSLIAGRAALYSIKPSRSHISTTGIVPISSFSDQPGPMTKTTKDLAVLMDIITDTRNVPSGGYVSRVTGSWEGLKIGTLDPEKWNFPPLAQKILDEGMEEQLNGQVRDAYGVIKQYAPVFKGNVPLSSADVLNLNGDDVLLKIFEKDFKGEFESYLKLLHNPQVKSLGELIAFNEPGVNVLEQSICVL